METKVNTGKFEDNWKEVGVIWKNEKSMTLKLKENLNVEDGLLVLVNKSEKEGVPAFRVWKKK